MNFSISHAEWEDRELDLHLGGYEPEPEYYEDKKGFWHHESGRFASDAEITIWKRYGRDMYDPDVAKGGHDYDDRY